MLFLYFCSPKYEFYLLKLVTGVSVVLNLTWIFLILMEFKCKMQLLISVGSDDFSSKVESCPLCLSFFLEPTFLIFFSHYKFWHAGTQSWPQFQLWPEILMLSYNWHADLNTENHLKTELRKLWKVPLKDLNLWLFFISILFPFLILIMKKMRKELHVNFCNSYF